MGKFVVLYNESECENPRSSSTSISLGPHFFFEAVLDSKICGKSATEPNSQSFKSQENCTSQFELL